MINILKNIHFHSIDSTSAYILRRRFELHNMTFVSADYQTAGRGRLGRQWNSNYKQNLMMSLFIKDHSLVDKYTSISVLTAKVICCVLESIGIKNVMYKWPNDVYVNDKKIAGILLESISDNGNMNHIVVGIGLNINQDVFNDTYIRQPTSVKLELHHSFSLKKIKIKVIRCLKKELKLLKEGKSQYLSYCKTHNYLKDKNAIASINGCEQYIYVMDIDQNNKLVVIANEIEYHLSSGEISFHK